MIASESGNPCWCCGRKGIHFVQLPKAAILIPCLVCEGNTPDNEYNFTGCVEKKICQNSLNSPTRTVYIAMALRKTEDWKVY